MQKKVLKLDSKDNVLIALTDLRKGEQVSFNSQTYTLESDVPAKHKFATEDLAAGARIIMYGVLVGKAMEPIRRGGLLTTRNIHHEAAAFQEKMDEYRWTPPDASRWKQREFLGYRRSDGQVGTRNYWIVVPLVFCENRNIAVLKQAFEEELGFAAPQVYRRQVAQIGSLRGELRKRNPNFDKPLVIVEQQQSGTEAAMLTEAIRNTFLGLMEANRCQRTPAPLSSLCVGLKCGGSDGFSGLSANPAIGHTADVLAALGGRTRLSEFPECCGVEQEIIHRSHQKEVADRFIHLMKSYAARAKAVGSGFEMNPSPGNMRDGLLTDAMKSAGAAKKGGSSPVT